MLPEIVTFNTKNIRKGLSHKESYLLSELAEKKEVFELREVIEVLNCSYNYAKKIVSVLIKKKWLIQIERGKYLIVPLSSGIKGEYTLNEFVIAFYLIKPYYIAYWSALNFHGLTEQIPFKVFVATLKRKKSKEVNGVEYKFVTLSKHKFFGYKAHWIENNKVFISSVEKTIVDCLDHPEYCGGIEEVAKGLLKPINYDEFLDYAKRMKNGAILKRFGFLAEILGMDLPEFEVSKGFVFLDPIAPKKGKYNTKWNIIVNLEEKRILEGSY